MKRVGSGLRILAFAIALAMLVPSLGTAWTARAPSVSHVDPSLRAGEVALVHTTAGLAGALSLKLAELGAVDIQTQSAANTVIARLSPQALSALATDPSVTAATSDIAIVATGDRTKDNFRFEGPKGRYRDAMATASASLLAIRAPLAWGRSTGEGVTVAVLDTGIADHPDLGPKKVRARVSFVNDGSTVQDPGGHGTFIAGLIAANGALKGVAPDADLVSVRVLDAHGKGTVGNVVKAVDWLLKNAKRHHIEVVNLSWGAPQATTYHRDLLSALVQSLWFSGMTVVAAAGNGGTSAGTVTAPGSDPFVITAGSLRDQGTVAPGDDTESSFSRRGTTLDGFAKPDTLAPGEHVRSLRVAGVRYLDEDDDPVGSPTDDYVYMTGTSVAAAFVSGVAALVVSEHKNFGPTQVKGAIIAGGRQVNGSVITAVDAPTALVRTGAANAGLRPSTLLIQVLLTTHSLKLKGVTWEGITWEGITWDGIKWDGVTWESIQWESISWESVSWESVTWERVRGEGNKWRRVAEQ